MKVAACFFPCCHFTNNFLFLSYTQNLSNEFRYTYAKLWMSILNVDRKQMRHYAGQLGIKGDLYALFSCMITGRRWESVVAGINRVEPEVNEKEQVQSSTTRVLPSIADILQQVDPQMLLILKTNDLVRGIERTLSTQDRKTSFYVMSKCCIESVAVNDAKSTSTQWQSYWTMAKLNIYGAYLSVVNFDLFSTLRHIW